eukprot:15041014-Alexandrium_andersonii.AAC.1
MLLGNHVPTRPSRSCPGEWTGGMMSSPSSLVRSSRISGSPSLMAPKPKAVRTAAAASSGPPGTT